MQSEIVSKFVGAVKRPRFIINCQQMFSHNKSNHFVFNCSFVFIVIQKIIVKCQENKKESHTERVRIKDMTMKGQGYYLYYLSTFMEMKIKSKEIIQR